MVNRSDREKEKGNKKEEMAPGRIGHVNEEVKVERARQSEAEKKIKKRC